MSSDTTHERFAIPNAAILDEDVWADEAGTTPTCRGCGTPLGERERTCPECGQIVPVCIGACSVCISPVCVGDVGASID